MLSSRNRAAVGDGLGEAGVEYAHRLMDYYNNPEIEFAELHAVLQDARDHLAPLQ